MSKRIKAETWGLLDMRRFGAGAKAPHEPFIGMMGDEVDPGDETKVGDWYSLQDGLVDGPYKTRSIAREELKENRTEVWAPSDDRGRVGRLVKVLKRYKNKGNVTLALFEIA